MNNHRDPFKIVAIGSFCYEFSLALITIFQITLALLAFEAAKFLRIRRSFLPSRCSGHNSFCSGHFPPFSPCREMERWRSRSADRSPIRLSRGSALGRTCPTELILSTKAGSRKKMRSLPLSSANRRKRQNCASTSEGIALGHKRSVYGELCKFRAPNLAICDDLIEVSSEYLKQKDRGHEEVILSLLNALQVERRSLRTLYVELDEERIASETAANEAMSKILCLQEEKSSLQMEADHYQRIAEEKAIHDEYAIQLLEEDLYRKENERLDLEQKLIEMRRRAFSNEDCCDTMRYLENPSYGSEVSKSIVLPDDIDEVSCEVEQDVVSDIQIQETGGSQCFTLLKEGPCKEFPPPQIAKTRLKSAAQCEKSCESMSLLVFQENAESMPPEPNDDSEAISKQLSIVEKQLVALEESEELWNQAQASQNSLMNKSLNPHNHIGWCLDAKKDDSCDATMQTYIVQTSDVNASIIFNEERVVEVDVANGNFCPCEVKAPAVEETLEFHENDNLRCISVRGEVAEEEKHLDLLSCVKRRGSNQGLTSLVEGVCKPISDGKNCNLQRFTLEGMNFRLEALESESTILQNHSAPFNCESMNLVVLKEIMQELQDTLKANRTVSNNAIQNCLNESSSQLLLSPETSEC